MCQGIDPYSCHSGVINIKNFGNITGKFIDLTVVWWKEIYLDINNEMWIFKRNNNITPTYIVWW